MASVDEDYKPSGRPTSMMAQRFSMLLDSSFGLDETTESVIKKKEEVASAAAELEELQARLAAMEEKLNGNKNTDGLVPDDPGSAHSRSRSVSQKPYLPGPIAVSVRPETPKSDKPSEPAAQKQATPARPAPPQQIPSRRFLSLRRKQPPPQEEDNDSEDDEEDSDESGEEEDDSETSSSEGPARRK